MIIRHQHTALKVGHQLRPETGDRNHKSKMFQKCDAI
jgi:hypothetical protein